MDGDGDAATTVVARPLNTFLASGRPARLAHKLSKLIHSGTNGDTYSLSPLHLAHLRIPSPRCPMPNRVRESPIQLRQLEMEMGNRHGRMFTWFVSHKFIGFIETSIWTPSRTTPDQFKVTRSNCVPREEILYIGRERGAPSRWSIGATNSSASSSFRVGLLSLLFSFSTAAA